MALDCKLKSALDINKMSLFYYFIMGTVLVWHRTRRVRGDRAGNRELRTGTKLVKLFRKTVEHDAPPPPLESMGSTRPNDTPPEFVPDRETDMVSCNWQRRELYDDAAVRWDSERARGSTRRYAYAFRA